MGWPSDRVVRTTFVAVDRGEAVDPEKIQDGWSARTGFAQRDCSGRPGARPSESASARGPKFLRSRPSSDLSFNVACQTEERACSTLNGPLLHNKDVEVPTGGAATGPLPATRPHNTARCALNICGGSTFIFKLGKPSRCRDDHDLVIHTCRRCAIGTGPSQRQQSGEPIKGAMVGPKHHDTIVGREEAVEGGQRTHRITKTQSGSTAVAKHTFRTITLPLLPGS